MALSRDGSQVAFVARRGNTRQVYLRALDSLDAKPIPGTEGAQCTPFFSPDDQWLGFYVPGTLKKVSIQGGTPGAPISLCNAPGILGATWGDDDTIIFGPDGRGLVKVSAAGGTPQPITTVDSQKGETGHRFPVLLPGNKAVIFTVGKGGRSDDAQIVAQRLDTGERHVLIEGGTYPNYVPTGHLVYVRQGKMMAVPFNAERLEVTGAPMPLAEQVRQSGQGAAQFGFSRLGSLVYVPGGVEENRRLMWVDRRGTEQPLALAGRNYALPSLSPDGRQVAVVVVGGSEDVWVSESSRDTLTRLTFDGSSSDPIWTPEGKRVTFSAVREGAAGIQRNLNLFWKPGDGSGPEERLTTSGNSQLPGSWSPDGKYLTFVETDPVTGSDIWVLALEGDRKPRPFLRTQARELMPKFSPDGRWLVYVSDESGQNEVYVQPFPGPGAKSRISSEGGSEPLWSRDGRELFYRDARNAARRQVLAVPVQTSPSFSAGPPRLLFQGTQAPHINGQNYDVAPNGQRFLMIQSGQGPPATQINVVLNWFEELKQRVSTGR